jgi:hypothetical protein
MIHAYFDGSSDSGMKEPANSVPIKDFREIFPNARGNDPYQLAVMHVVIGMSRVARKSGERVKCWFERAPVTLTSKVLSGVLASIASMTHLNRRLDGLDSDDKSMPLLQAPDLAAEKLQNSSEYGHSAVTKAPRLLLGSQ